MGILTRGHSGSISIFMNQHKSNNPPSLLDDGRALLADLGKWLDDNPVIETEDVARDGKLMVDRASACIGDLETERRGQTDPLNKQVKDINETYSVIRNPLQKVLDGLKARITAYLRIEEEKRIRAAEEARRAAEEAEQRARAAEAAEKEAEDDAAQGVADTQVATKTIEADRAFAEFQQAARAAALAEKETNVKVGGGFRRALSLRAKKTLILISWKDAIEHMGMTDKVRDSILSSAREYRAVFEELPNGVKEQEER